MTNKQKLNELKNIKLTNSTVSLAVIKEYKKKRVSHYSVKYVPIDEKLEARLKNIVINKIKKSNSLEKYTFDCPEPEEDQVRAINSKETDFDKILESIHELSSEEDIIENVEELVKAKSYLIIFRINTVIKVIGFKKIPENWKMKKSKGLIHLLFNENRFEDLEEENIFSISGTVDFIFFANTIFVLSKKAFETGLNFREGMLSKAKDFYEEAEINKLFINLDILSNKVGNNQRYLRKIATIKNLGHYNDKRFLMRFKEVNTIKKWGIDFQNDQIVITEDKIDSILTILQNKRLHSDLTEEDFDVESVKALQNYLE